MTKRLINIDDDVLQEVTEILGTTTMTDTVNGALQEIINHQLRMAHLERLRTMKGMDLNNPEIMAGAWRRNYPIPDLLEPEPAEARSTL